MMSRRNGDRARFQKDRKRKLLHRQRVQALLQRSRTTPAEGVTATGTSADGSTTPAIADSGPIRAGE
jgi:hypothetical protein